MLTNKISLDELLDVIKHRIESKDDESYSSALAKSGVEKITRKVGEEAVEVMVAAFANQSRKSDQTREELIGEICDLLYHVLVLMASQDISYGDVIDEIDKRNKGQ